ncbi:hypothetical protein SAMN05421858_1849 [Haladaptatus litoreus]|uniref:Uncharacterized protein n=1 Tax=Haladaptatus litoreus TaxID=553468 RepID=A0A1N6Z362_9EURY|nr:hypothetical protein [Haladaptatus litoreus]SIR21312.1 hypothetical protein SAMN05421858_1849 [Haladaptatus litoreus]
MSSQSRPLEYADVVAFVVALASFTVHGLVRSDGIYRTGTTVFGAFSLVVAIALTMKIWLR